MAPLKVASAYTLTFRCRGVLFLIMLDIKLLRESPDLVKEGITAKNADPNLVDEFLRLDKEWRSITAKLDERRGEQRKLSQARDVEGGKKNKEEVKALEAQLAEAETKRDAALQAIPGLPDDRAPRGKGETENVVLREVGKRKEFETLPSQ